MKSTSLFLVLLFAGSSALAQSPRENFNKLRAQFQELVAAHEPAIAKAKDSTVAITRGDALLCFGCVVRADGWILTKASEVTDGKPFKVALAPKRLVAASIVQVFEKHDLALIKVDAKGLTPISWYTGGPLVAGSFVAAPGALVDEAIAIGVYSVKARNLDTSERAFLGVSLDAGEGGIKIGQIIPDTPAQRGGLKADDIILELDGKKYTEVPDFIDAVGNYRPGDKVTLRYRRGDVVDQMDLTLGKRPPDGGSGRQERYNRMNQMGGELSETLTGFPSVFQTDLPIRPEECGGPVCNLNGEVIGINIARAGRIKTYAIPGRTISELLEAYEFDGKNVAAVEKPKQEPAPKLSPAPEAKPVPAVDPLADLRREVAASVKAVAEARKALERAEQASQAAAAALKALDK